MPGNEVKDWTVYHRLREKGYSKESAARIANAVARRRRRRSAAKKVAKHYGPGPHKNGTSQSVHGGDGSSGGNKSEPSGYHKIHYEREICSRCGGSGHYSYNPRYGTVCFKCGGSGKQLTKDARKSKQKVDEFLNEHFSKPASQIKKGDYVYIGRRVRRNIIEATSDAKPDPHNPGFVGFDSVQKRGRRQAKVYRMIGENATVPYVPKDDEWQKALDFAKDLPGVSIVWVDKKADKKVEKHYGPGPHANGTPQSIHGGGGGGKGTAADTTPSPSAASTPQSSSTTAPLGSKENPYRTDDIDTAVELLAKGKYVEFTQPRAVATMIDKLADVAQDMEKKGEKAPNFDLCKVTVKGLNLFCVESKGLHRIEMPQFSGKPVPGSQADQLPKNEDGEVDVGPAFVELLKSQGVAVKQESELASYLKASQMELVGKKVSGIMKAYRSGKLAKAPIFVSSDNYVIDGHHRWAAMVGIDLADNKTGDVSMPIMRVDMPVTELLFAAKLFTTEVGIAPKVAKRLRGLC